MAMATMKKLSFESATHTVGRRQPRPSGAPHVIAVRQRSRSRLVPQAFYLRPYSRGSCRPSHYYHPAPSSVVLSSGLGLLNSMLASDWLREATSSVHPMDIKTFEDRYEIYSDCPGMAEEDVEVEVSPDRVLTVAGSRKTPKRTAKRGPQSAASAADPPEVIPKNRTLSTAAEESESSKAEDGAPAASAPDDAHTVSYRFRRSFVLPDDAEVEGVGAVLERGVLTVTVPRRAVEKPKPRRVSVKAGGK